MTSHARQSQSVDEISTVSLTVSPPGAAAAEREAGFGSAAWWLNLRRRRLLVAGGIAAAVLAAAGATSVFAYSGEVPRGTKVLGIDLGGKSRTEAAQALRAGLSVRADRLAAPVPVRLGARTVQVEPAAVGLAVNVDATVEAAANASAHPVSLLFGSRTVEPVIDLDAAKLDDVLRGGLGKDAQAMRMPAITYQGTIPKPTYPKPGTGLDPDASARAVRDGWFGIHPVTVPLVEIRPATTADEVDRLIADLARPAVSAPVTVTTDRGPLTVPPAAIAASLTLTADKTGKITPRVDEKKLRTALAGPLAAIEVPAKDGTVAIVSGKPTVVASADGRQLDTAALSRDLLGVLPNRDGRTVAAAFKTVAPTTTTEVVTRLGIKERVSTFTTKFPGGLSSPRSQNIVQIAKEVDGALVKPGQTFSLNGHTGERSYAQGYKDAPVIVDGKLTPGVGGGASQFTTTLFNAAYYAGLEDVEHKPHSYYFDRYPPVIESTIFYPDLDFKFRNNTQYGVVIDTAYTADTVTVSMWSTKVYDSVTTQWSERRNITKPQTIRLPPGPKCIATNGIDGFTQDAYRIFRKGGKEIKREKFTWTYQAEPRYLCGS